MAKYAPETKNVLHLLRAIRDAAQLPEESERKFHLLQAVEAVLAPKNSAFTAALFWKESSSIDLGQILVSLYGSIDIPVDLLGGISVGAETAIQKCENETRGANFGPRSSTVPASDFLEMVIPLYQDRGGRIEYYDDDIADGLPQATPLVRFVRALCEKFVPIDWPGRESIVSNYFGWSERIKKVRSARRKRGKKPVK